MDIGSHAGLDSDRSKMRSAPGPGAKVDDPRIPLDNDATRSSNNKNAKTVDDYFARSRGG
jgi:hypothetical protein